VLWSTVSLFFEYHAVLIFMPTHMFPCPSVEMSPVTTKYEHKHNTNSPVQAMPLTDMHIECDWTTLTHKQTHLCAFSQMPAGHPTLKAETRLVIFIAGNMHPAIVVIWFLTHTQSSLLMDWNRGARVAAHTEAHTHTDTWTKTWNHAAKRPSCSQFVGADRECVH
jgi:hypothetical protein